MPTALVTGAAHGIGKAIAAALAAEHYDLHLICRESADELREQAAGLENSFHVSVSADAVDVSDAAAVERYFAEKIRRLDLLINNAGISRIGLLQDTSVAEWNTVISTNLSSVFYTCRCAIPLFLKSGSGRIINISSVWGSAGASMETAYSASKGGVNALTRALAKELAPNHIPVNAIACGVIDTRMNGCFNEDERRALRDEIPADRFGSPEETAAAVVKLSQMPDYLTGQIITFDGGWI
jgi:3-oxoacyl-[acyl-carrier protein] reductase